jgi:hypothetical protein
MVAIPVAELLHTPPAVASASVTFAPTQLVAVPVIEAGLELPTVNVKLAVHEPIVYVIMETPVDDVPPTMPDEGSMDATDGTPLVHVPPATALLSVVVDNVQMVARPVIAAGVVLTVNAIVDTVPQGVV